MVTDSTATALSDSSEQHQIINQKNQNLNQNVQESVAQAADPATWNKAPQDVSVTNVDTTGKSNLYQDQAIPVQISGDTATARPANPISQYMNDLSSVLTSSSSLLGDIGKVISDGGANPSAAQQQSDLTALTTAQSVINFDSQALTQFGKMINGSTESPLPAGTSPAPCEPANQGDSGSHAKPGTESGNAGSLPGGTAGDGTTGVNGNTGSNAPAEVNNGARAGSNAPAEVNNGATAGSNAPAEVNNGSTAGSNAPAEVNNGATAGSNAPAEVNNGATAGSNAPAEVNNGSAAGPNAPAEANNGSNPVTTPNASGAFVLGNNQIIGPDGQVFVARGLNDTAPDSASNLSQMLQDFPGVNFVRLNSSPSGTVFGTPGGSIQEMQNTIDQLTAKGIVVEVEDHSTDANTQPNTLSGADLQNQLSWYSQLAAANANNPYVWFGTPNEPMGSSADIDTQVNDVYGAIRGAGNNNPILIDNTGGGEPDNILADASSIRNMTNVGYDVHFYQNAYATDGPNDPNNLPGSLQGIVSADQGVQTGDAGKAPVIVGEYGAATDDVNQDSNGLALVNEVNADAQNGVTSGSAAWIFNDPNVNGNQLVDDNNQYTAYGAEVANYINGSSNG